MNTMEEKFNAVKKEIRKNGVKVRVNIQECCRSCVSNDKLGIKSDNDAIIWHYGGQGHAISWVNGLPVARETYNSFSRNRSYYQLRRLMETPEKYLESGIYFNHNALTPEQQEMVINAFINQGFVVEWENREYQCIWINFEETFKNEQIQKAVEAITTDYAMC